MSSGSRFVLPYQTVIDASGVPIPGALLFFYLTETSTPANTYADANLTVANTNPVIAGANGQFPSIFLDPSLTYKVVLTDGQDNQVWTADPVTASAGDIEGSTVPVGLFTSIPTTEIPFGTTSIQTSGYSAFGIGAALYVLNTAGGLTPNAYTAQSQNGQWFQIAEQLITPQMFGAKGDGATNDIAAIQALHDYYEAKLGGCIIGQPSSVYKCNSGLTANSHIVGMEGNGVHFDFSAIPGGSAAITFNDRSTDSTSDPNTQFGSYNNQWRNFRLIGPAKTAGYVIDAVTPASVYAAAGATTGVLLNTPVAGLPGKSSRPLMVGIEIEGFTTSIMLLNQAYLAFIDGIELMSANFGIVGPGSVTNAGENIVFRKGVIHDCDVACVSDGVGFTIADISLDFNTAAYRGSDNAGANPGGSLEMVGGHYESGVPTITPFGLIGAGTELLIQDIASTIDGNFVRGSLNTMISTTLASQLVTFQNNHINNWQSTYLITGPARTNIGNMRSYPFPPWPSFLSDSDTCDYYGANGFEDTPLQLPIYLNANNTGYATTTVNSPTDTNFIGITRDTFTVHSGVASLAINKKFNAGTPADVLFLAPIEPNQLYWWTFWYKVNTPSGSPVQAGWSVEQYFCNIQGYSDSGTTLDVGRLVDAQIFQEEVALIGIPWTFFETDLFNHGTSRSPSWANYCVLRLNFFGYDGVAMGNFYVDDLHLWGM